MKDTRRWTNDEIRTIRTHADTHSVAQVAAMLGRNRNTTMSKARQLGISYAKLGARHPSATYSAEQVRQAVEAHTAGESIKSIAQRLNVPYAAAYNWCTYRTRWSDVLEAQR